MAHGWSSEKNFLDSNLSILLQGSLFLLTYFGLQTHCLMSFQEVLHSLPPMLSGEWWDYRCTPPHLALLCEFWGLYLGCQTWAANVFYQLSHVNSLHIKQCMIPLYVVL